MVSVPAPRAKPLVRVCVLTDFGGGGVGGETQREIIGFLLLDVCLDPLPRSPPSLRSCAWRTKRCDDTIKEKAAAASPHSPPSSTAFSEATNIVVVVGAASFKGVRVR